jgi:hypothetical protein
MRKTLFMNTEFSLSDLMQAIKDSESGKRPVESWNPSFCGEIDIVIKADGSWWHEGSRIGRAGLIGLFASVLRKDEDGLTYLVTPAEKLLITVERAHFIATRVDISGTGKDMRLFFTTDYGGTVQAGPGHPLRVETDPQTLEPAPFVNVRGRLEAALTRSVFYELAEHAAEIQTDEGPQLGVYSGGVFFPLGPPAAHLGVTPNAKA